MRALIALFIWMGIPIIVMRLLDLHGTIWTILLCGVCGVGALFYYALSSKPES